MGALIFASRHIVTAICPGNIRFHMRRNVNPYVADALERGAGRQLAIGRQSAGLGRSTQSASVCAGISAFAFQARPRNQNCVQ